MDEDEIICPKCQSEEIMEVGVTLFSERKKDLYSFVCNKCNKTFQRFRWESIYD